MSGDRLLPGDLPVLAPGSTDTSAQVDLRFVPDATRRTWLERQRAAYPFHVGRCLNMAGDPDGLGTVYVQSCSGGIFEHDVLRWQISVAGGAQAHVTTSASTIVHGMESGEATQEVLLDVEQGAYLEYLPDPLILFPGARLSSRLRVKLAQDAVVLCRDAFLPHDPHSALPQRWFDRLRSEWIVQSSDGRVLAFDRSIATGELLARGLTGVNGPNRCYGSFFVLCPGIPTDGLIAAARETLRDIEAVYAGVSALPNGSGAIMRALGTDAAALRAALHAVWTVARMFLLGVAPSARRK